MVKNFQWYPADDEKSHFKRKRAAAKKVALRKGIAPGTVLILLSGRFRGKRVVFLKQLDSGLLLVTGPYKINGVPLKRVNQAYVIVTSTVLDVKGVDTNQIKDAYFKKEGDKKAKSAEAKFFEADGKKVWEFSR
jgi:large subunit ribosomal protein L6e